MENDTVTIQLTAKRLKFQSLLGKIGVPVGVIIAIVSNANESSSGTVIGTLMAVGCLIWVIVTKVRIWWSHE